MKEWQKLRKNNATHVPKTIFPCGIINNVEKMEEVSYNHREGTPENDEQKIGKWN